jgi:Domain of unknown function (DUF4219)
MSSNNQSIETHVSKLDGSNFQVWAGKMQVYLRLQGLWNMVRSLEPNTPELGEGFKPEYVAFHKKEWLDWSNRDNQEIGII